MPVANLERDSVASGRRAPRWLLLAAIAAIPLTIVAVAYVIGCWRAHAALAREMAAIEERGEPVWFSDWARPADEDAVERGKVAARLLAGFDRVPTDYLDDVVHRPLNLEEAGRVEQIVDGYRRDLHALVNLLGQGECRFDYDYQSREPSAILLTHVQNLRGVARLLKADFQVALTKGERSEAVARLDDMFELDRALEHDPFVISQYVRQAIAGQALDALQSSLARAVPEEEDLCSLCQDLNRMESDFQLAGCLRAERSLMLVSMESLGNPGMGRCLEDSGRGVSGTKAAVLNYWWGSWPYRPRRIYEEAIMLRTMSRWSELVDEPGPSATRRFDAVQATVPEEDFPIFFWCCTPFFNNSLRRAGLIHRQRLVSAQLALAVYGYRIRHGRLPESLAALKKYPVDKPVGLLSGKPLVYEQTADGFAIYDELPEQGRFEVRFARGGSKR
ncbi:MAG TPA: hypothetical protein VFI31_07155 [Pirellulales bacterium]|nr:hypothetical protein [Pirellulales bacterium]